MSVFGLDLAADGGGTGNESVKINTGECKRGGYDLKISKTKKNKVYISKTEEEKEPVRIKEFLDLCSPSVLRFYPDYYICGSSFRSVWATGIIRQKAMRRQC